MREKHRKLEALPANAGPTISADISRPIGNADIRKNPKTKPVAAKIMNFPISARKKSINAATAKSKIMKGFLRIALSDIPGITIEPNIPPTILFHRSIRHP